MLGTNLAGGREPIGGRLREVHEGMELPEYLKDRDYGSGMVASFTKEKERGILCGER
ncbi:hypothetical protein ACJ73_05631 [Blastomyces percursus]|uniref:Uncharacterized protein n=1 Tax=Blastomyces percursus TaxID=1658174 RepID=A0A1J9R5V5_9EURO|nr:hypothetical protein ACJ73_05631 [Blastomyces percursus]